MKRILFVITQLYKGGAEIALVNLLKYLDYDKYQVDLLVLNQEPVANAVSLLDSVDKHVKICNAYDEFQKITIADRVRAKLEFNREQKSAFYFPALDFVKDKEYDWAFSWGEWFLPSFVAYHVKSRKKAMWIHSDISTAISFNGEAYFYFYDCFDYCIFVSQNSMKSALACYPFLKDKAYLIYNICDIQTIRTKAQNNLLDFQKEENEFTILTCANVREEKNHFRQIDVMYEMNKRGYEFRWINIGSTTDTERVERLKNYCRDKGLEEKFLFLGAKENPYPYMKASDMVAVLSDYESWSMVITEAKILGIPVIATKTSGATEQIIDGETGILTGFDVQEIADKLESYLKNTKGLKRIRNNLKGFDNTKEILNSFDRLTQEQERNTQHKTRLLYIIDDVNYMGGAHNATFAQINDLQKQEKLDITVFSTTVPVCDTRTKLSNIKFASWKDFRENVIYNESLIRCLFSNEYNQKEKKYRFNLFYLYRIKKYKNIFEEYVLSEFSKFISQYDMVCVMSEGSIFRKAAAASSCRKKIQWIHTDYCAWREKTAWTKEITKADGEIYRTVDTIVVLSEKIKAKMEMLYPHLKNKIVVNKNLMPVEEIKKKANKKIKNIVPVKFITVGRIDDTSKAYFRLIKILHVLHEEGYLFDWSIVGSGEDFARVKEEVERLGLKEAVHLKGAMKNPFVEIKKADVFALLSTYEGLPNTIYEALILGIPVLATDVGGIADQVIEGNTGWLVKNDEEEIYKKIEYILMNQDEIAALKEKLQSYEYDNKEIKQQNYQIFDI